ncbi:MAG TPA: Crp/Fnr family transcriptional regulator [Flavisolibacter sp.]|jgi:CRP/FNR family transcriptional regulator|nr:Crp/Fnr family transcriptional regulator [Flavisolibacter sp.]
MNVSIEQVERQFPQFEQALILEIVRVGQLSVFDQGDVLLKKGQYIRSILLILDGTLKVYRENEGVHPYYLYFLQAGDACVISLMFASQQNVSDLMVKAETNTSILSLPLSVMQLWMKEYSGWNTFVWDCLRKRMANLFEIMDQLIFHSMEDRLMYYLKVHSEMRQSKRLPFKRTEMAHDLNTSREVVTRLLKKQSEKGLLKIHGSFIEIQ